MPEISSAKKTTAAAIVGIALGAGGLRLVAPGPATTPTDHDGVTRAYLQTVIDNQGTIIDRLAEIREAQLPATVPPPTTAAPAPARPASVSPAPRPRSGATP